MKHFFEHIHTFFHVDFKEYVKKNFEINIHGCRGMTKHRDKKVFVYPSKPDMVNNILSETKYSKEETIFFDDQIVHVQDVENYGVDSVHVCPLNGISSFDFIINNK